MTQRDPNSSSVSDSLLAIRQRAEQATSTRTTRRWRYCAMCDRWFKALRQIECPACGDATVLADKPEDV